MSRGKAPPRSPHMRKWVAAAICVLVTGIVVTQWPEIERYRRIRAM